MNDSLDELFATISSRRKANADDSYVASLNRAGLNKILEKVGEEAVEVIIAAKEHNDETEPRELTKEMAVSLTGFTGSSRSEPRTDKPRINKPPRNLRVGGKTFEIQ